MKHEPPETCECGEQRRTFDAQRNEEFCFACGLVFEHTFIAPEPSPLSSERVRHPDEPREPIVFSPKTFIRNAQAELGLSEVQLLDAFQRERRISQRVQNNKHRAAIAVARSGVSMNRTAKVFGMCRNTLSSLIAACGIRGR